MISYPYAKVIRKETMLEKMERIWTVRPNLGNPLILTPEELKNFSISLAYKLPSGDSENTIEWPESSKNDLLGFQCQLQTGSENSCFGIVFDNTFIPFKVIKVRGFLKYPRYEGDYPNVRHAITSAQQQYRSGFRWEVKVDIGLSAADIKRLKSRYGWPALLDIESLFDKTHRRRNYHAIYVHETLKRSGDFTILHITDTHIAQRNDLIPEILCSVRNRSECDFLKSRYINFNDNLRAFIREANRRIKNGEKVISVLTGDLTDHYFDGYWDGKFICGHENRRLRFPWPDRRKDATGSTWNSNIRKFQEIITGRDGKGEALQCPIFTILGNHDYVANEVLLNFSAGARLLGVTRRQEDYERFFDYETNELEEIANCAREYDFWAYPRKKGKTRSTAERKPFKEIIRTPANENPSHRIKTRRYNNWRASLKDNTGDKSFWLVKPQSRILTQYLSEINYDLDFEFKTGNCHLLFLNTSHDLFPHSKLEFKSSSSKNNYDYIERDGPHCRGITDEHIRLVRNAIKEKKEKLIFVFTHAPLLQIQEVPEKDEISCWFEDALKRNTEDNLIKTEKALEKNYNTLWEFLRKHGQDEMVTKEMNQFFHDLPAGCFKKGKRKPCLDFYSAEGCQDHTPEGYEYPQLADKFLNLISQKSHENKDKPIWVLSGHTHSTHEFRIEKMNMENDQFYFYIDNYSEKYPRRTETGKELLLKYNDLKSKSPFLLTSNALENKTPKYREISVRGLSLTSLKMKGIPRIEPTADFSPGCYIVHLCSHDGQYVCIEQGGNKMLVAEKSRAGKRETFEIVKLGGTQVALKACNGKFVRAGFGGKLKADSSFIKKNSIFTLIKKGENKIALQAHNGKYVSTDGCNSRVLRANRDKIGEWEILEIDGEIKDL